MTDGMFKLGTFRRNGGPSFVGLVAGDHALDVAPAMGGLLDDWDRSFEALQERAQRFDRERAEALADLRFLPPVPHPSKILNAAANYRGHVAEMQGFNPGGAAVAAKPTDVEPYLFLKAASALSGAYDDIVI